MFGSLAEKLFGQSHYARYALIVSFCQAFAVSILEGLVLKAHTSALGQISKIGDKVKNDPSLFEDFQNIYAQGRSMTVYSVLFIVTQFFQLGLCTDALYHQNTIQFIALSLFIIASFAYSAIQVYQSSTLVVDNGISSVQDLIIKENSFLPKDAIPFEVTIIVVMFISSISFAYLAYKLYQEFGWTIYKKIGADMEMRDRYKLYQIFIMLLKFSVFFYLGFSVQFLALVVILEAKPPEIIQHVLLSVLTSIGMIIVGFWGVKTERKILMYLFMLGCFVAEGYIIWKIVDVTENENNKYRGTKIFVSFFLYVSLVLGFVTFAISICCLRNFDKGLKYHLSRSKSLTSQVNEQDAYIGDNGDNRDNRAYSLDTVNRQNRHTQRWSID